MRPILADWLMPVARRLDPERAHHLGLQALRANLIGPGPAPDPCLGTRVMGLDFPTPIGLAAGFDKDALAVAPLRRLGFGFVEVGTVTRNPQPGNARPRLFRLTEAQAVINRMGFNGSGMQAVAARLARLPASARPIGVNLGLNKQGAVPDQDYATLAARLGPLADYLVINISSPNTPGLRDLQAESALARLLASLPRPGPPVLVKLAPDLADAAIAPLVAVAVDGGAAGLVLTNTMLARPPGLGGPHAGEAGGLSGRPLFARATALLAMAHQAAAGRLVLIGVGGVMSGADALTKLKAGANLVQIYTAFAYGGPAMPARLNAELAAALRAEGFARPADAVGVAADSWLGAA